MAVTKCKFCGQVNNTDSGVCSTCASTFRKRRTCLGCAVLVVISLLILIFIERSLGKSAGSAVDNPQTRKSQWNHSFVIDEMSGKKLGQATSSVVGPAKPMDFPYHNTKARLGVRFSSAGVVDRVFIEFNISPNLLGGDVGDGYHDYIIRFKWDNEIEEVTLRQDWGSKFLYFIDYSSTIDRIKSSSQVRIELQWHGNDNVYFDIPMNGAKYAMREARRSL